MEEKDVVEKWDGPTVPSGVKWAVAQPLATTTRQKRPSIVTANVWIVHVCFALGVVEPEGATGFLISKLTLVKVITLSDSVAWDC